LDAAVVEVLREKGEGGREGGRSGEFLPRACMHEERREGGREGGRERPFTPSYPTINRK